jgi:hypothetical protein
MVSAHKIGPTSALPQGREFNPIPSDRNLILEILTSKSFWEIKLPFRFREGPGDWSFSPDLI